MKSATVKSLLALLIAVPASCFAAPAVVQSANGTTPSGAANSITVTLGAQPAAGDVLFAFITNNSEIGNNTGPNASWVRYGAAGDKRTCTYSPFYHVVVPGDGPSYTFSGPTATGVASAVLYELSGVNTAAPVDAHGSWPILGSATKATTPSLTPTQLGDLPLAFLVTCSYPATPIVTPSPWAVDQYVTLLNCEGTHEAPVAALSPVQLSASITAPYYSGHAALTLVAPAKGGGSGSAPSNLTYGANPLTATVGTAIASDNPSYQGGAPTAYTVSPTLPPGLQLDSIKGVVSGTPTAPSAQATYTITASNGYGSTTVGLVITVNSNLVPPANLTYATNSLVATVGTPIANDNPSWTGGTPTSFSVSPALPAGLHLDAVKGVISGTPTAAIGQTEYTITASNSVGSTQASLSITVNSGVVAPSNLKYSANPLVATVGTAIANDNPSWSGGTPTAFSVSPALPAGLLLNGTSGVITGTPTTPTAQANYTITASNTAGSTQATLTITVNSGGGGSALARIIAGAVIFTPGTYPFNDDISNEAPQGVFTCEGHCTNGTFGVTQAYLLHIDGNTTNELEPVAPSAEHKIPDQPFKNYTTLEEISGSAGDKAFEAIDPVNNLAYEVYDVGGTPPANTNAYSGCVDSLNAPLNVVYGPCNGESGWHDNAIAGGLIPEEIDGVYPQPNGTMNHALVIEEPGCGGGYCGAAPQRVRLRIGSIQVPNDPQAYAVYYGLTHYGAWTTDGGGQLAWPRVFEPQPGKPNYDSAVSALLNGLNANMFDVMPDVFHH